MTNDRPATVAALFAQAAETYGERPFLLVLPETADVYGIDAGEITYAAAQREILALTERYRHAGYGPGDRVGLLVENRPCFFFNWFALNALAVSVVPINQDLRASELEYLIGHSELIAAVVIPPRQNAIRSAGGERLVVFAPEEPPPPVPLREVTHVQPGVDSEAALLYTSGTTGRPKGCILSNDYFLQAGRWYCSAGSLIELRSGGERMLTPLPLFHMNAMAYSAMAMLSCGGCLTVLDRFHPRTWWQNTRQTRATVVHYLGVMPTILMAAAARADDRQHAIRFGFGAGVDRSLHAGFEERFGFPLIEAWAMTETGAGAVIAASQEPRHIGAGCFGRPHPVVEVRIMGEAGEPAEIDTSGELHVRCAGAAPRAGFFSGYLKDQAATAAAWADGWFHTGDIVRQGADGSMYFVDRLKNIIRRSGENISAVEVESVLLQHTQVHTAAVAPVADPVRGEEVFACVIVHQKPADAAARARLAADIVAWCLERLAYYKAPGFIAFVEAVPLTTTQKIQRGQLKELVAASLGTAHCIDTRALKKRTPP